MTAKIDEFANLHIAKTYLEYYDRHKIFREERTGDFSDDSLHLGRHVAVDFSKKTTSGKGNVPRTGVYTVNTRRLTHLGDGLYNEIYTLSIFLEHDIKECGCPCCKCRYLLEI